MDTSRLSKTALLAWGGSAAAVAWVVGMVLFLALQGGPALCREGAGFLTEADWFYRGGRFGAAAMIFGAAAVAGVALTCAVPVGVGTAVMTAELLSGGWRWAAKCLVELLAGIPSVVYGLLGVLYLRPLTGDSLLTAGILVGIMILPTVMSLSDDAFRGVPRQDREAARALGLTGAETFFHAVLPKALPGIVSAVLLGLGRAMGETIAVYLVVGRADNRLPGSGAAGWLRALQEPGQTLTSKLGGAEVSIGYGSAEHWSALAALGLLLFLAVAACVLAGEGLLLFGRRYRE